LLIDDPNLLCAAAVLSIGVVRIHAPLGTGHSWSATASQIIEPCVSSVEPSQKSAFVFKLAGINDFILLWVHCSGVAVNFVLTLVGRLVFIYVLFVALFAIISHGCTLMKSSCVCASFHHARVFLAI
jgi:hypothetical protein